MLCKAIFDSIHISDQKRMEDPSSIMNLIFGCNTKLITLFRFKIKYLFKMKKYNNAILGFHCRKLENKNGLLCIS